MIGDEIVRGAIDMRALRQIVGQDPRQLQLTGIEIWP